MEVLLNRLYKIGWIAISALCIIHSDHLKAQPHYNVLGMRAHYGFIIAHSRELRDVATTHPWIIELEKTWQLTSYDSWKYCFCYPKTGISFLYINFDSPVILGEGFGLQSYVEPVWNINNSLYSTFRFGIGPIYLNKVYNEDTNPTNTFYSSPVSFIVLLRYTLNYRINNNLNLSLSPAFNHISNGGIRNPNKGINFPTVGLGLEYTPDKTAFPDWQKNNTEQLIKYKYRADVIGFATGKTAVKGHARYWVRGITTQLSFPVGRINAVTAGLEFAINGANKKKIEQETNIPNTTDHKYLAVVGGHEWLFGRFNFGIQLGAYIYSPYKHPDPVYHRWNLTYYFTDHIFAGINLKAHYHVADFLGIRMGYSLFKE
ncbi:MAG: acyloxyacyl hydrolase [Bacteroidetes bacterium]|jgi:hypothetical protein|nr:acyloxyacyl hydrolase [Bacteroidota bacterium]